MTIPARICLVTLGVADVAASLRFYTALGWAASSASVEGGGTLRKPGTATEWGGYSGYFADPDGHLWEVAHNPFWPLDADGRVVLPE